MLSLGSSYAAVGKWASGQRPARIQDPKLFAARLARTQKVNPSATTPAVPRANYWQTGADWVERFSPVLWDAWQEALAREPAPTLPRVLVVDDIPFFGGPAPSGRPRSAMVFSVLVATEYFQPTPTATGYDHRVRLIRAYPKHTTDAYELLLLDTGVLPDVIVSDSSASIIAAVNRMRRFNPGLVWVPSAFHIVKQLRKALAKMSSAKLSNGLTPGDLKERLEDHSLLTSQGAWRCWWADLDNRMNGQGVPMAVRPTHWHTKYHSAVDEALAYLRTHPAVPRGTGAVEAQIHSQIKPFFESRAAAFTNIERVNRAADLLTLRLAGRMDNRSTICDLLRADASMAGGFMPAARQITDPQGLRSLRDPAVLEASLRQARKAARGRWPR